MSNSEDRLDRRRPHGLPDGGTLAKADYDISIWNRSQVEGRNRWPQLGAKVGRQAVGLSGVDMLFAIVRKGKDLEEVYSARMASSRTRRHAAQDLRRLVRPISVEDSERIRGRLKEKGIEFVLRAGVGNGQVIKAGSCRRSCSGPEARRRPPCRSSKCLRRAACPMSRWRTRAYLQDAHNVMLGVVHLDLVDIRCSQQDGRAARGLPGFMNNGVMGSMFTAYKTPGFGQSRLDRDLHGELLRKDLDLGLNSAASRMCRCR